MACLCAPTSHEGSFRCRLHRAHNLMINPVLPSPNRLAEAANQCSSSSNAISSIPNYVTVRESAADLTPPVMNPHSVGENGGLFSHFPQSAADCLQEYGAARCIKPSSLPSETSFAGLSVTSSSSLRSRLYRQPLSTASSPSLYTASSSCSSAAFSPLSSSRQLASCRPPPAKSRSTSSLPKCPHRTSLVRLTSWRGSHPPSNNLTPSPSHAAAMAIMKQHIAHSKRAYQNRNTISSTSASKSIGPSRLSRMAVACADELHTPREENSMSALHQQTISAPDASLSSSFEETSITPSGLGSIGSARFKAMPIGLNMRSGVNVKLKQNESSCRVVGNSKGSFIVPTVY